MSLNEIEMAKAELAQLEHRFRLRVEHGQTGIPLPPRVGEKILDGTAPQLPAGVLPIGHHMMSGGPAPAAPGVVAPAAALAAAQSFIAKYAAALGNSALSAPGPSSSSSPTAVGSSPLTPGSAPWASLQSSFNPTWLSNILFGIQQPPGQPNQVK